MATCGPLLELSEQLCYVQCSFCSTILLVSVPCASLLLKEAGVTVRCGHCQGLLSVNISRSTSFLPLHLLASLATDEAPKRHKHEEECNGIAPQKPHDGGVADFISAMGREEEDDEEDGDEEEDDIPVNTVVNKPPEKRQRAPSAYNRFIKEEIKRIKAAHPSISHKEAFSAAAKNWAHFPRIQQKTEGGESCDIAERDGGVDSWVDEQDSGFRDRKACRRSMREE